MTARLLMTTLVALTAMSGQQDWQTTVAAVKPSIVRVETRADGKEGSCTGVVLNTDPGYVATCAHCVKRAADATLAVTVNGRHATLQVENGLLDLAILSFRVKHEQAVRLAPDVPQPGAPVAVIGYPFGVDELMPQAGIVSGYNHETKLMWLNVDVIFGDSGGLAFDAQGRLVGITSNIFSQGPAHMGAAVPLETVRDFVEDFLPQAKHPWKRKE